MQTLYRRVELAANVAIIVAALALGAVLVKRYVLSGDRPPQLDARVKAGTKISLPGVDWARNERTLLLVLSEGCHFCSASSDFYKHLAQEKAAHGGPHIIAILPQDVSRGKAYLSGLGVTVDEVRQSALDALGVKGTPTLLLVDGTGKVTDSWVGKLSPEKEAEVLNGVISAPSQAQTMNGQP